MSTASVAVEESGILTPGGGHRKARDRICAHGASQNGGIKLRGSSLGRSQKTLHNLFYEWAIDDLIILQLGCILYIVNETATKQRRVTIMQNTSSQYQPEPEGETDIQAACGCILNSDRDDMPPCIECDMCEAHCACTCHDCGANLHAFDNCMTCLEEKA